MDTQSIHRRQLFEHLATALGFSLSSTTIGLLLTGCENKGETPLAGKPATTSHAGISTHEQALLLDTLTETILPRTDTPGASDAKVAEFIIDIVSHTFTITEQNEFYTGLNEFNQLSHTRYGKTYATLPQTQQNAYTSEFNAKYLAHRNQPLNLADNERKAVMFIGTVKNLTLLGFYTSQIGATQVLQYNPIPGAFKGCVPLKEIGKAWATS